MTAASRGICRRRRRHRRRSNTTSAKLALNGKPVEVTHDIKKKLNEAIGALSKKR
jgi:hypothetical protein